MDYLFSLDIVPVLDFVLHSCIAELAVELNDSPLREMYDVNLDMGHVSSAATGSRVSSSRYPEC